MDRVISASRFFLPAREKWIAPLFLCAVAALYFYFQNPLFSPVIALALIALPFALSNKSFLIGITLLVFYSTQSSVHFLFHTGEVLRWAMLGLCLVMAFLEHFAKSPPPAIYFYGKRRMWYWILLGFAAFSSIFSVNRSFTLQYVLGMSALLGVVFFVIKPYAVKKGIEKILDLILYMAFPMYFFSLFLVGQAQGYNDTSGLTMESIQRGNIYEKAFGLEQNRGFARFHGIFENPNTIGIVTGLLFPLVLHKCFQPRNRKFYLLFAFLMISLLLLSASREGILASILGSFYILIRRFGAGKIITRTLGGLLVLSPLFFFLVWHGIHSGTFARYFRIDRFVLMGGRLEAWIAAVQLISHRPWLGYGFGTESLLFRQARYVFMFHEGGMAHNAYLGLILQIGIPGALLFFIPLFSLLFSEFFVQKPSATRIALQAVLFCGLILCFFESWIYSPGNSQVLPFWTAVALLEYLRDAEKFPVRFQENHANCN